MELQQMKHFLKSPSSVLFYSLSLVISSKSLRLEGLLTITLIFSSLYRFCEIQVWTLAGPLRNVKMSSSQKKQVCKLQDNSKPKSAGGINNFELNVEHVGMVIH